MGRDLTKPPNPEETYAAATYGLDEPSEMWMTGDEAIELLNQIGKPPIDKHGDAIDPLKGYYLSAATGLVPMR